MHTDTMHTEILTRMAALRSLARQLDAAGDYRHADLADQALRRTAQGLGTPELLAQQALLRQINALNGIIATLTRRVTSLESAVGQMSTSQSAATRPNQPAMYGQPQQTAAEAATQQGLNGAGYAVQQVTPETPGNLAFSVTPTSTNPGSVEASFNRSL